MRKLVAGLVVLYGLFASSVHAADLAQTYVGIGFSDGSIESSANDDKSLGSINVTAGLNIYNFLGLELEAGVASDHPSSTLREPLVSYQAAMLRLGWRWDRIGVYVLGGQALLDVDSSLDIDDSGNAMGLGFNLFGNPNTALNFHFLRLADGAFTSTTIGFQHYFGGLR